MILIDPLFIYQDSAITSILDHSRESLNLTDFDSKGYSPTCYPSRWWEPRFHSTVLEQHWKKKVIEFLQRRYRIALLFIGLFTLLWIVFFSVQLPVSPSSTNIQQNSELSSEWLAIESVKYSPWFIIGGVATFIIMLALLCLTFWKHYAKVAVVMSVVLALVLMGASCALAVSLHLMDGIIGISTISFVAQFTITAIVILVVFMLSRHYIVLPVLMCTVYVIVLEALSGTLSSVINEQVLSTASNGTATGGETDYTKLFISSSVSRLCFHLCLILCGVTTAYLSQIQLHDTFWHIGQCVITRELLESERDVEEKTIHSMMPRPFAEVLLQTQVQIAYMIHQEVNMAHENVPRAIKSISNSIPFTACMKDRVSILFADIVGFTSFSSMLNAAELVSILNEVFSSFDELTLKHKCEKISTLGDCYFCVSGCPEADAGHADNCVEMGLSIIKYLEIYRQRTGRPISMRVGIHTGSVLCGVMGTKRFKFDVWSRDVTIANKIESVGMPGRVLVSQATKSYLSNVFSTEEAMLDQVPQEISNLRLYFVSRHHDRSVSIGSTSVIWKQRIRNIDSVGKGNDVNDLNIKPPESKKSSKTLSWFPWRRPSLPPPMDDAPPSHTLRDSLSRHSHLQRCASYADIANPRVDKQEPLDCKIVQLMEEHKVNFDSYFDPRLHMFSAFFGNSDLEKKYRNYGRDIVNPHDGTRMDSELGFKITKISYIVDVVTLIVVFILIMVGAAINLSGGSAFSGGEKPLYEAWLIIFVTGLFVDALVLACVVAIYAPQIFPAKFVRHAQIIINWYMRSLVALFLIYYPMSMVVVSLTQCYGTGFSSIEDLIHVQMAFYITIVVLISSINFMGVSYVAKVVGGVCSSALTVILVSAIHLNVCALKLPANETSKDKIDNRTILFDTQHQILENYYNRHITPEAVILLMLILALLTVVNRMSEVSVRLSFIGRIEAAANKQYARQQKNQAQWLLFNIIPPHVAMELRATDGYSCNHEHIGVMFASIVNFSDFTRSQRGGEEESFRLLNRIVREFDNLLDKRRFCNVEKIKTIGSTYMAASGLNLPNDRVDIQHLIQLIDFAFQLGDVLRRINILVPGFAFHLRIGFNYGPVTSGVVGSRKMMYDIWGDTVNVASRMDSTGQVQKVHAPEQCMKLLGPHVTWDFNRVVDVKGKGKMRTVFITGRK